MKIIYLTYGEPPSGVYSGQVCDVVNYLRSQQHADIRLVAFISLQQFSENKNKIRKECPDAIVFPMLPKAVYWKFNVLWLFFICLFLRPHSIMARNVIAANMALRVKAFSTVKKVCFDGRGAIAAEWSEYDVTVAPSWKNEINELEKRAVLESDCCLAVSNHLVQYWRNKYGYSSSNYVVIPCTISAGFIGAIEEEKIAERRKKMGFTENDTLFAYSGSTAGWQSFHLLKEFLDPLLNASSENKVVFLAKEEPNIESLQQQYPGQVTRQWLSHTEVKEVLSSCDFGVLIRENTVTNQVASPTKFAEYLACGLPVIISDNLGDYSEFVVNQHCGIRLDTSAPLQIPKPTKNEKLRMTELVRNNFTKQACDKQYAQLVNWLTS